MRFISISLYYFTLPRKLPSRLFSHPDIVNFSFSASTVLIRRKQRRQSCNPSLTQTIDLLFNTLIMSKYVEMCYAGEDVAPQHTFVSSSPSVP